MNDVVYIEAPYPAPYVTMVLPNPKLDNTKGLTSNISALYTEDGTVYTYVTKRSGKKKYLWSFSVSADKANEVYGFFDHFSGQKLRVEWQGVYYIGYIVNNPIEVRYVERAGGWPGGELVQFTIEFRESDL